jgi:hypothetical protein
MGNNVYGSSFLSAGGNGYKAPFPRKSDREKVVQQLRTCKNRLARTLVAVQRIAQEQEQAEQRYTRLAKLATLLIEVVKQPGAGSVLTETWIVERDQAILVLQALLGGTPQQNEITEAEMTPFQRRFQEAMHALIGSPDALPVLRYFRAAYEYRKHVPWLTESTRTPDIIQQTGLSYALQTALVDYTVLDESEALSREIQSATGKDLDASVSIDPAWREELTAATTATVQECFNLERFEEHLARARIPADVETLKQHITAALLSYHKRREVGTIPDPWDLML